MATEKCAFVMNKKTTIIVHYNALICYFLWDFQCPLRKKHSVKSEKFISQNAKRGPQGSVEKGRKQ
jgi:hypothetical protein